MILEGTYEFMTPREKLWEFIIDPAKISKCLPDLKNLHIESADKFVAIIRVGVGPIRTDFKFRIEIVGKEPLNHVMLRAVGSGSGSSITLDTAIDLKQIPDGSQLFYRSDVKVAGMMASLGQRVIKETADKTISGIFECIKNQAL
jgi:carbon monoxide dehydrogenase subunit G